MTKVSLLQEKIDAIPCFKNNDDDRPGMSESIATARAITQRPSAGVGRA